MVLEPSQFGILLRQHRVGAGLTQEELAERAGISARAVSDLERGVYRTPKMWTARQIVDALGLTGEDRDAFEAAARGGAVGSADRAPARVTQNRVNLPISTTPFLGRSHELGTVQEVLRRPEVRLVTLTGPGGTGKTRLAIEAARDLTDRFPHGVFFVSLAPLADPQLVLTAIAHAVADSRGADRVGSHDLPQHIGDRHLLLILDNFEHLLPAATSVRDLLVACPNLAILITSRVLLHLTGEHQIPVPPMSLPSSAQQKPDTLQQFDATALFIARAQAVNPAFEVTAENAAVIASICSRLDGLPLAIELAAARVTVLSPQALLERLSQGLGLLRRGARDAPERQQTMRNTIDWSYRLLDEREQILLARLAVFTGGCSMEAAERVCGGDVLDDLSALVESSLVRAGEGVDGEPRFHMLETIREYGLERLHERNEEESVRQRHAEYYLDLAERVYEDSSSARLGPPRIPSKLKLVDQEHGNIVAALGWLRDHQQWITGIRLTSALKSAWNSTLRFDEIRAWFSTFAPYRSDAPPLIRARFLLTWADHKLDELEADNTIDPEPREQWIAVIEEAVSLYREAGDQWQLLRALIAAPYFIISHNNSPPSAPDKAERLFREGLEMGRRLGSSRAVAGALRGLAGIENLMRQNRACARALYEEALSVDRAGGNTDLLADTIGPLAILLLEEGEHDRGAALLEEAIGLHTDSGNKFAQFNLPVMAAARLVLRGNTAGVLSTFRQARRRGLDASIDEFLQGIYWTGWLLLVAASVAERHPRPAAVLYGAAHLREAELFREAELSEIIDTKRTAVRAALGEQGWTDAWAEGCAMPLEQALNLAMELE